MASATGDDVLYQTPETIVVCSLECQEAFAGLTANERIYAHHIAQASWAGSLICLGQTSPTSGPLFKVVIRLFSADPVSALKIRALAAGVSEADFDSFVSYVAFFLGNMGNYLSFGDTKFVPRCSPEAFKAIVAASSVGAELAGAVEAILSEVYDLSGAQRQLGLEGQGVSSYYTPNITRKEIEVVQEYIASIGSGDQAYNTRVFRREDREGKAVYDLMIASAEARDPDEAEFKGVIIRRKFGDHSPFLTRVAAEHKLAAANACNDTQRQMHEAYAEAFTTGDIEAHKRSQRLWVGDKGPAVECNVGFIESYRDPFGVRGEWEGFVAVVNRAMSVKFQGLVDQAVSFIALLPWPRAFEKDTFLRPDFTSLDVVAFASSGVPAGINIPNYDDIRQNDGFKNVSLGNVLSATSPLEKLPFLAAKDEERFKAWRGKAFEVQVGLHELLGHGSGKLLVEEGEGKFNFDRDLDNPLHPGEKVQTWYKSGETWDSKFGAISSSYEECRAECVGIYLCTNTDVLDLFGHKDEQSKSDLIYINWLLMARAGLLALEYYTPESKTWRQAHMQGRYAILRTLINAGEGLVTISVNEHSPFGAEVLLDESKIESVGRPAVGAFLQKLNVYKSTADKERGTAMYNDITSVPDEMLPIRQLVIKHKQPRKVMVQGVTRATEGDVALETFESNAEGIINSFTSRFGPSSSLADLVDKL